VEIEVNVPPPDITNIIRANAPALAGLAVILLIGLALFIFISQGRIQPGVTNTFHSISSKWVQFTKSKTLIKKILPGKTNEKQDGPSLPVTPYRLIAINDISQQIFPEPVKVDENEIKIGRTLPGKGIQIQHSSVIKEHSSITCLEDGKLQITDLGSTAGTWINYKQIQSGKPKFLKDGDIIHFGEAIFRLQVMTRMDTPRVTEEKRT
ncbi:MAG: FHA domain-containing protein, partial [Anaerolineales bacterium]|nr:FHA domain-containing protein [Anaerolineales bacterium]